MLDVHPPHESAHSWTDFFIHIATIVVGLLIAIGLEQSVEWVHHRSEVRETRKLLKEELETNIVKFHDQVGHVRMIQARLRNDLRVFRSLQEHPGTPYSELPGYPSWGGLSEQFTESAWMSAKQSDVLSFMPKQEVEQSREIYAFEDRIDMRAEAAWECINSASVYDFVQPDVSKLTRSEIDAVIPLIQNCLNLAGLEIADLNNLGQDFSEFSPGPSMSEISPYSHIGTGDPATEFPKAYAFLKQDQEEASALDRADQPSIEFTREISEQGLGNIEEIYTHLHAQYPNFKPKARTLIGFGSNKLSQGDAAQAIQALQFASKLYPDEWRVYDSLGEAYVIAGERQRALESYQRALKLNPNDERGINALTRLQH